MASQGSPDRANRRLNLRGYTSILLCAQLICRALPVLAQPSVGDSVSTTTPLDPNQRVLHLLNRLTFGPTTEDIAKVRQLGIKVWLDQQLHPARIPDDQLTTRLREFPALQLSVPSLLERFPSGADIRQAANGKRPVPNDLYLSEIYKRHIGLYQEKQAKKAEAKADQPMSQMNPSAGEAKTPAMADGAMGVASTSSSMSGESAKPSTKGDDARPAYGDARMQNVLALPPPERVNRILTMRTEEYQQFNSSLKGPQRAKLLEDMTPTQRELVEDFENPTRTIIEELQSQRLLRDIYSSHQLQEVMTSFWLNHFNIFLHKNEQEPYYLVSFERDVIRPRALGKFEDLLVATAESPAMMIYLDNSESTGPDSMVAEKQKIRADRGLAVRKTAPGLNENYARELMELHTLGVNGGYSQKDVTEVAKVLTGWTVDKPGQGGGFKFDENRHEPGKKLVLGHKIKNNGQKEGLQLLHMLATSPATAHFISQELATTFVSDTPSSALVDHMAKAFQHSHGDIPTVLKAMVDSPEFWAPAGYQGKVKTPLEYVVSAARASGANIENPRPLINALNQMGMPLYSCVPPTGYSAKAEDWVSTGALVTRMNFALTLASNRYPGVKIDWSSVDTQSVSPEASEQTLEARLIPTGVSQQTRSAVLNQSQAAGNSAGQPANKPVSAKGTSVPTISQSGNPGALAAAFERQNQQLAGLLIGSPEFQRR